MKRFKWYGYTFDEFDGNGFEFDRCDYGQDLSYSVSFRVHYFSFGIGIMLIVHKK